MHEVEFFAEYCVIQIVQSDLPVLKKRSLIKKVFEMEAYGDCAFTQLRTIEELIECQYTFLFKKEEMFDYNERKRYYDFLAAEFCEREETSDSDGNEEFDDFFDPDSDDFVYAYWSEKYPEKNGLICVDSGKSAWKEMVLRGHIRGDGAIELEEMDFVETIGELSELLLGESLREYTLFYLNTIAKSDVPDEGKRRLIHLYLSLTAMALSGTKYGSGVHSKARAAMVEKGWAAAGQPEGFEIRDYAETEKQFRERLTEEAEKTVIFDDEEMNTAIELDNEYKNILRGLYAFAILTNAIEKLTKEDYLALFGMD